MGSTGKTISTGLTSTSGWDYREYTHFVDRLETEFNDLQSNANRYTVGGLQTRVNMLLKSIDSQDGRITKELEANKNGTGDMGDERVLMANRKRVRLLKRKVLQLGKDNI